MKTPAQAQKDRVNAGYQSTSKKQRLTIQSISDFIKDSCKNADEAIKWAQVQTTLLVNLREMNSLHKQHLGIYGQDGDASDNTVTTNGLEVEAK